MTVAKVQSGDNLPEESPGLFRRQSALFDQVIEEFSSGNVFQHQIEVSFVLVHVVQPQHVRMLDQLHDGDLAFDLLQHGLGQLVLVDDLDGHFFVQHAMRGQLHEAWKHKHAHYKWRFIVLVLLLAEIPIFINQSSNIEKTTFIT